MRKYELKYTIDVPIKNSQFDAFYLGINAANNPGYMIDIFNDYGTVRLVEPDLYILNHYTIWIYRANIYDDLYETEFQFDYRIRNRNTIFDSPMLDYLKEQIEKGFYITGLYNEQYISAKKKDYLFHHDFILYGFDDEIQSFISAGYIDGIYQRFYIPYREFAEAAGNNTHHFIQIRGIKPNPKYYNDVLDLPKIYIVLRAYLESVDLYHNRSNSKKFGIEAANAVIDHMKYNDRINPVVTGFFSEFRMIYDMKLKYLLENGFIKDFSLIKDYENLYRDSNTSKMLAIKYNMTMNINTKNKVISQLYEQLERESVVLSKVLKELADVNNLAHLNNFDYSVG